MERENRKWDAFISHASEDKGQFVRPLAEGLRERGLTVWLDERELKVGDRLRRSIDYGLKHSRFGIVVLSPHFFEKQWPQDELDGLAARETDGTKVVLPVWHNIDAAGVHGFSPILADRFAISSSKGLKAVIDELMRVIDPGVEGAPETPQEGMARPAPDSGRTNENTPQCTASVEATATEPSLVGQHASPPIEGQTNGLTRAKEDSRQRSTDERRRRNDPELMHKILDYVERRHRRGTPILIGSEAFGGYDGAEVKRGIVLCVEAGYIVGKTEYEADEFVTVDGLTGKGRGALEKVRREQTPSGIALAKRTFMLFHLSEDSAAGRSTPPIGTAFGAWRPGLVLTAKHVVRDMDPGSLRVVCTYYKPAAEYVVEKIVSHPEADVAALLLETIPNQKPLEHFSLGLPWDVYPGYNDFPLAEDVLTYGFPMVSGEKPIKPRMMKGHIQSVHERATTDEHYRYSTYELSLTAFPGLSGAPVFRDLNKRDAAIGIVTARVLHATEQGTPETTAYATLAAALHSIADWIRSL